MTTATTNTSADVSDSARGIILGLLAGILFAAGLVVSGMTDPAKVLGFLNIAALFTDAVPGEWDPSLAFVMGGAVIVTLIAYRHTQPDGNHKETLKSAKPWLTTTFSLPNRTDVDWPLISGGAMFGVVPKTMWQKLVPPDENNLCTWAMRCLLIEDDKKLTLIDNGIGDKQDDKLNYY